MANPKKDLKKSDKPAAEVQNPDTGVIYHTLTPGDAAPWFQQRTPSNPEFGFDTLGGRYVVLAFFGSTVVPAAAGVLKVLQQRRHYFDDVRACFFGVTLDQQDEMVRHLQNGVPGIRFFFDFDGRVSKLYGSVHSQADMNNPRNVPFRPMWVVIDRMLRVVACLPFKPDGSDADKILPILDGLPPFANIPEPNVTAPVLILPNIFEPELCQHLISLYEADGGEDSGFMNQRGGKTIGVYDYSHKRRRDYYIEDQALISNIHRILYRRLIPYISRAFQYNVTRIERNIVACYSSNDGGHFNAHRDNTTTGTAHRRFAVTLNLNDAFEGGELSFPEFGSRSYRASVGGAVVFSCTLLHQASVVTKGTRYAFLPFMYDEAAAKIRDANHAALASNETSPL